MCLKLLLDTLKPIDYIQGGVMVIQPELQKCVKGVNAAAMLW